MGWLHLEARYRINVKFRVGVSNWSWLPTCAIAMSMRLYCTSEAGSGCLVDLSTSPRRDDSTNHGGDVSPSKAIVLRGNIVV